MIFYECIKGDVEKHFDPSNYDKTIINRPLHAGRNKKVIGLMKDKVASKIVTKFATTAPNAYG